MAWNYTTLKQAIQDFTESDEPTLVSNLDIIIRVAEDQILQEAQLPDFRKAATGTLTAGSQYLAIPADHLAPYSLAIDASGWKFLLFKKPDFIRAAYPVVTDAGTPKHYAIYNSSNFILGPTPSGASSYELNYFCRPTSIVDGATSWLGTNAETALLYGCLREAYGTFLRGDEDVVNRIERTYQDAMTKLKLLAEGRNQTDEHRVG